MTLIALTLNHGYPILMADLLISSPYSDGVIEIPTFVNGTGKIFTNMKGNKPLKLQQKLYIINDRLCVALGGRGDQMYTFLKRMKTFYGTNDFDDGDLLNFVDNYPKDESNRLIAIVLKSQQVNGEFNFTVRSVGELRLIDNGRFDKVFAGGSGARQFLEFINTNPRCATDITNLDALLVMNQQLISYWLGQEVARAESLSNCWGAGYEMVIFENGRFLKLDEYTVIFLAGKLGKDIKFEAAPVGTIMIGYQEDVLIIRVFANGIEKVFAVPSIVEERDGIEVVGNEPKHETLLISYILDDVDRNIQYFPSIFFPRNKNELGKSPIVLKREGNKLQLYKDNRLDNHILSQLSQQENGRF